jgi:hypothetical protein
VQVNARHGLTLLVERAGLKKWPALRQPFDTFLYFGQPVFGKPLFLWWVVLGSNQ